MKILYLFIFFPENWELLIDTFEDENDIEQHFKGILKIISELKSHSDVKLIFDETNINAFFRNWSDLDDSLLLDNPKQQLRILFRKTSESISHNSNAKSDCLYFLWNLNQLAPINYAPNLLSEIAERKLTFTKEKNSEFLLLNLYDSIGSDRSEIIIIKDAKHLNSLPVFVRLPFVQDYGEFELWKATHHIQEFSLLDKLRFQKTSEVQQGKPVFKEIKTGYYWYLDNFHKNEYEVFDKNREHIGIANLKGELDFSKAKKGRIF